jgi:hypothetical protein
MESELTVQGASLPRTFCDDRLYKLDIGYWSMVPIQNELAASLISFYIETDHSYLGFLDMDLFLEDLIHCRQHFCSSFLVSAMLYNASVGGRFRLYCLLYPLTAEIAKIRRR